MLNEFQVVGQFVSSETLMPWRGKTFRKWLAHYLISREQARQCVRRLALSVPHSGQRVYIVRANQLVISALTTRMPPRTATLKSASFNLCTSP